MERRSTSCDFPNSAVPNSNSGQIRILAHVQIRIIRKFDSAQSPVNETDPEEKTITAFEISLQSTDDCFAVRARMNLIFF